MRRHKAAAINEPRICSQLICWYVLYYRASLDLTKKLSLQQQHARNCYSSICTSHDADLLLLQHFIHLIE